LLKKTITANYLTIADLLAEFPHAQVTLAPLIELLPKQKPRLYSISSSPALHPQQIQITVGVVQVVTDAGKTRQGLCSNYLAGLTERDRLRLSVRTSSFRPPSDPEAVTLMVGPGTGVSPLIAFLQDREAKLQAGQSLGEAWLYFGCRNYNDYLYQEQLQTWLETGVLSGVEVAFSRLGKQKVYVQHLMREQASQVWQILSHPKCHYYVCGDAKMADDVFEVLMDIAKEEGGLSHTATVEFFEKMKKEQRFSTDVWGVTLNYKSSIEQLQKDNYSQAQKWLDRVSHGVGNR
ncbi:MAG: nitric-oxide synthase, partial [Okeania sp. SIO2D1]|nr:nitric-oxide synthase [Okeania sp. SIO2D1]